MIILFQALRYWHKMQTLESANLNNIVLKPPVLCFERHNKIDVLEQSCNRIRGRVIRIRDAPENVGRGQAVALDYKAQTHRYGRVAVALELIANFWRYRAEL